MVVSTEASQSVSVALNKPKGQLTPVSIQHFILTGGKVILAEANTALTL